MYPAPSPVDEVLRFQAEITAEGDNRVVIDPLVQRVAVGETTCTGQTEIARG